MDAIKNNSYRPLPPEKQSQRPQSHWYDRAIDVAVIAGAILILAGVVAACVAAGVFCWPLCLSVVPGAIFIGGLVITCLVDYIFNSIRIPERDHLINFRKWHQEQVGKTQPLTIAESSPARLATKEEFIRKIATYCPTRMITTYSPGILRINYEDQLILPSEEIQSRIVEDEDFRRDGVFSQDNEIALFDDYKKKVKDCLPPEFSSVADHVAEDMLLVARSKEIMSAPREKATRQVIEGDMNRYQFFFNLCCTDPEISCKNEGDTVKLRVKSRATLWQQGWRNVDQVEDVWLVSEFTYKMKEDGSSFEKAYQYRTEYVRESC